MTKWRRVSGLRAGLGLCVCAGLSMASAAAAQSAALNAPAPRLRPAKDRLIPDHFPAQPTVAPTLSIPVDPLGFSPPGPIYLGARNTLASLDFIGEDKLLFTFRVPGLLHRDAAGAAAGSQRQIRAVVLSLPTGTIESEATWTLYDRDRYLWMLHDGRFLLRDRNKLLIGDSTLTLKPFLQFPGPLLWLELDPGQQYLVTDSYEPPAASKSDDDSGASSTSPSVNQGGVDNGTPDASATDATADAASSGNDSGATPDTVVRILERGSGKVMLVSRVRTTVHLPINSAGYLENLRGQRWQWLLNMSYYQGGSATLTTLDSNCDLTNRFISDQLILATTCTSDGDRLVAVTTSGHTLWADQTPAVAIWPLVRVAPGGLRIARETLGVTRAVNSYSPIDSDDIKGQWLTVYDAATGDLALETPVSPPLDAGGNVAISPSARRVAVLNAGALQIFDLPPPPALPDSSIKTSGH
jgi:hypothetical protein